MPEESPTYEQRVGRAIIEYLGDHPAEADPDWMADEVGKLVRAMLEQETQLLRMERNSAIQKRDEAVGTCARLNKALIERGELLDDAKQREIEGIRGHDATYFGLLRLCEQIHMRRNVVPFSIGQAVKAMIDNTRIPLSNLQRVDLERQLAGHAPAVKTELPDGEPQRPGFGH